MYLFVYKTTHKNGKYYIGRHQTDNLNDGYFGSGTWVESIKDKSTLSREIIAEANSFDELCELEEFHIRHHYGKQDCMNFKRGSVGLTSEDAIEINKNRVKNGDHNFLGENNPSHKRVEEGTHNFLGPTTNQKRIDDGTHIFLDSDFQREVQRKRLEDGTHNFLGDNHPMKIASNNGTHHFTSGEIQQKAAIERLQNGTHHFLGPNSPSQFQWHCENCGKTGRGKGNYNQYHGNKCKSLITDKID